MLQPQPLSILHVDDDDANRYVHTRMLQRAGFNVIEAGTGLQALQIVAETKLDLIVLDVKLPDIHGFEVCRRIKADPTTASIPVLHLSASFVQMEDKAEALEGGADGYLTQPVEARELIATVNALLRMRQAEEIAISSATQWQTTFDSISDGICLLDSQNKVVRCNQAMAKILGKWEQEIIGCTCNKLWQNVGDKSVGGFLCDRIYQSKRQSHEIQINRRWFGVKVDPILGVKGDFTGTVQILTDITERKLAEAARTELLQRERATREQAEANSRMKDEFLAIVSHELRSPLNAILGWSKLLRTRKLDESVRDRAMETIERNALLQVQMIEDLLDISRIIRGTIRLSACPIELKIPIEAAIQTVLLAAQAKEIQLTTAFDPTIGMVSADSDRLQQVIWNLLSNAIKFTPPGGSIEVRLSVTSSASPVAQIQIIDTGCGISKEFIPHVFDRFRQQDGSMTRSYSGLGLGLAIARQLVELHGGTLKAQSQGEGKGATFTIELPLISRVVESIETQAKRSVQPINSNCLPGEDLPKLNGKLVLVVDDEEDNIEVIKAGLQEYNVEVITANSALKAMEIVTKSKLDAIVSDIGMPNEDGYELIKKIRDWEISQKLAPIGAIALTAYAREEDRQRAITSGFQMHLSKPIEPYKLALAISQLAEATALNK
ncbi:MAG: response regulator [Chroococcus sp. CMT-3BRIN-NPC107]|jgi:PAS domain S-box-containing protein|nr:response regulator [Chroococcus sp. CMT-3BRIN-NPC107]